MFVLTETGQLINAMGNAVTKNPAAVPEAIAEAALRLVHRLQVAPPLRSPASRAVFGPERNLNWGEVASARMCRSCGLDQAWTDGVIRRRAPSEWMLFAGWAKGVNSSGKIGSCQSRRSNVSIRPGAI